MIQILILLHLSGDALPVWEIMRHISSCNKGHTVAFCMNDKFLFRFLVFHILNQCDITKNM